VPTAYAKLGVNIDPANIKEGDNVYFVCDVSANPPVNNVSWLHNVSTKSTKGGGRWGRFYFNYLAANIAQNYHFLSKINTAMGYKL
jgi:hypothetical protein